MRKRLSETATVPARSFLGGGDARNPRTMLAWDASLAWTALLLLALGCFLAGVHLDWLFVPVGLLLTLTMFLVAKADQYLWLMLVAAALPLAGWIVVKRLGGGAAGSPGGPKR